MDVASWCYKWMDWIGSLGVSVPTDFIIENSWSYYKSHSRKVSSQWNWLPARSLKFPVKSITSIELRIKRLSDIHHPDIHHLRQSSPQTFITPYLKSDIHHPGHSSPQTFITSDIHHLRRSSPQTFITPYLKSDIHHLRRSSPPT